MTAITDLTEYEILLINNGLMFSHMTRAQAKAYIDSRPDFLFKDAAL